MIMGFHRVTAKSVQRKEVPKTEVKIFSNLWKNEINELNKNMNALRYPLSSVQRKKGKKTLVNEKNSVE